MFRRNKLTEDLKDAEKPCCDNPRIVSEPRGTFCRECGADLGRTFVDQGAAIYTAEDIATKKTNESAWRKFGPRTTVGNMGSDVSNMEPKLKGRFYRLAKIQGSLIGSIERNLAEAKPQMKKIADDLNLPRYVRDTAEMIYTKVAEKHLTLGRSINGFVAAATYIAIRLNKFIKLFDDVVEASMVPERTIITAIQLISKEVLPEMGLKYSFNNDIALIIYALGNKLNLPLLVIKEAISQYFEQKKTKKRFIGQNPKGVAAAYLYIACKKFKQKKTQLEIAAEAKITEVTLRARVKEILGQEI